MRRIRPPACCARATTDHAAVRIAETDLKAFIATHRDI
jgi:hypothetical protein